MIIKPKKPSSALRPYAIISIAKRGFNPKRLYKAHIPGEGHNLTENTQVWIRGGKTKDVPGVRFKCIRGKGDLAPVQNRKRGRSHYGAKKN